MSNNLTVRSSVRISRTTGAPLDWTASQCAAYRGISRQQWLDDVENGLEPPARGDAKLWDAGQVRAWKRPDEWYASEAAHHHGLTAAEWTARVRHGEAPPAAREIGARRVWKQKAVREAQLQPSTRVTQDPEASGWTGKECADYLGIQPRAWRAAVRAGDAPQPSGYAKDRTRVWDPTAVMAWSPATGNGEANP